MKMHFVRLILHARERKIKFNDFIGWEAGQKMESIVQATIFGKLNNFFRSFFAVHDSMQNMQVIKQLIQNAAGEKTILSYSKTHNILWPLY